MTPKPDDLCGHDNCREPYIKHLFNSRFCPGEDRFSTQRFTPAPEPTKLYEDITCEWCKGKVMKGDEACTDCYGRGFIRQPLEPTNSAHGYTEGSDIQQDWEKGLARTNSTDELSSEPTKEEPTLKKVMVVSDELSGKELLKKVFAQHQEPQTPVSPHDVEDLKIKLVDLFMTTSGVDADRRIKLIVDDVAVMIQELSQLREKIAFNEKYNDSWNGWKANKHAYEEKIRKLTEDHNKQKNRAQKAYNLLKEENERLKAERREIELTIIDSSLDDSTALLRIAFILDRDKTH